MSNDSLLHATVRIAMQRGDLPRCAPARWSGAAATGARCAVCGAATTPGEVELELEFADPSDARPATYRVHPACFRVFVIELGRLRAAS